MAGEMGRWKVRRNTTFFCTSEIAQLLTGHGEFGRHLRRLKAQIMECNLYRDERVEVEVFHG